MVSPASARLGAGVVVAGLIAYAIWADRDHLRADDGPPPPFRLTESAADAGLVFEHRSPALDPRLANVEPHVAGMGAAVAVADADGDGWPDLYVTTSAFGHANALFRNKRDGTFEDVAASAGVGSVNREGAGVSMGAVWGDVDNDGDEDLFVYKWGRSQLFRNDGDLTFTDVTKDAGLDRWMNANAAVWLDYDRDGRLDLYVAGYFHERHDMWNLDTTRIMHDSFEFSKNAGANVLYRNVDGARFEDVTEDLGVGSTRWTLAAASADFDDDGWPDLYLANDYGPEELFLNKGGKRFELVEDAGLEGDSKSGMAVALGDIRNEGKLAVYVTNISQPGFLFQGNNLRLNLLEQSGRMENIADGVVADCGWAWGAQFGDLDNDGDVDLVVANGFISGDPEKDYWYDMAKVAGGSGDLFRDTANWAPIGDASLSGYERNRVLLNDGRGGFRDVAEAVGAGERLDGRAVAFADLSNRGVLDMIVANQRGPLQLYRNEPTAGHHWVAFELVGTRSNRSAIGAHLLLQSGDRRQLQAVTGGVGFCSQNDRRLHFGLGAHDGPVTATIRWPSGAEQTVENLAADRLHRIEEPR